MKKCKKSTKTLILSGIAVLVLTFLDQITKYLAVTRLKGQEPFSIIDGVFELRYLENQSAAFSFDPISFLHKIFHFSYFNAHPDALLTAKMIFFAVLTIIVLILLSIFYCKLPWNRHWLPLNCVVIGFFAGAIGNLIDRLMYQYVVDFFYFKLIKFPIFNVADIYVTLSAALLIISVLFLYKEQDFESVFPPKTDKKAKKDM